jgi:pantothenate kinase-related protein Tda10
MSIDELVARVRDALPSGCSCPIVGIAGPPGGGKSTLGAALCEGLSRAHALGPGLCISLDDFYLTPTEREARGHTFRAPPGTHDLSLLARFLYDVRTAQVELEVPRYDREHELRLAPGHITGPLALCVFEGWFVGAELPGYEELARALDCLVYVDMDLAYARQGRLERERRARDEGRGGMAEAQVTRYWDEVLEPGIVKWVLPLRERADVVVKLDATHRITAIVGRSP